MKNLAEKIAEMQEKATRYSDRYDQLLRTEILAKKVIDETEKVKAILKELKELFDRLAEQFKNSK